jgi:hypothetical protein
VRDAGFADVEVLGVGGAPGVRRELRVVAR